MARQKPSGEKILVKERDKWYRLTVRLTDEEFAPLERLAGALPEETPNSLARAILARVTPDLAAVIGIAEDLQDGDQPSVVTATDLIAALVHVYDTRAHLIRQKAAALHRAEHHNSA